MLVMTEEVLAARGGRLWAEGGWWCSRLKQREGAGVELGEQKNVSVQPNIR